MSATATSTRTPAAGRTRGLRINCFAAAVILLLEYGLGIWVNLYGRLPASDHGAGAAAGFGRAITQGPVGLSIHAALGIILLISAIAALVRAILVRRAALIGAAVVGLLGIALAGLSGSSFVGNGNNTASLAMAYAAGVAIIAYVLILFISRGTDPSAKPDA
jgi:hypothetical protein